MTSALERFSARREAAADLLDALADSLDNAPSAIAAVLPLSAARLLEHMSRDKKTTDGQLTFVMTRGIGQAFLDSTVDQREVLSFLEQAIASL